MPSSLESHDASPDGPAPDGLESIVAGCLERDGAERAAAVAEACRRHPELAAKLAARLQWLGSIGLAERARPPALPDRLGDFKILSRLGGGGMGVVHLAEQVSLGRHVALKTIRPEQLWFPGARERFEREVRTVALLKHPGIVPVYAVGEEAGVPYFAMEWIEGQTLAELMVELAGRDPRSLMGHDAWLALSPHDDGRVMPPFFAGSWAEFAARVAHATADALAHAHGAGVLHRDVKPSNVMVTRDGRALLFDFGLASAPEAAEITRSGTPLGSLPYMSPEQLRGAAIDARSDVWSLGATLHELLAFESPFLDVNAARTAERIARGDARPLDARRRGMPWELGVIVARALEVEPARRYAGAAALRDDFARFLAHEPVLAQAPGALRRARRFAQRRPAAAVALALGALIAVVLPSALYVQERIARARLGRASANVARTSELLKEILFATAADVAPSELSQNAPTDELLAAMEERVSAEFSSEPKLRGELLATFGRVRMRRHEVDKAVPALREAIDLLEANGAGISRSTVLIRWLLVDALSVTGRLAEAESLADETLAPSIVALHPEFEPLLLAVRGTLRLRVGKTRAAEADLRRAVALADARPDLSLDRAFAHNRLGAMLMTIERAAEALPHYEQAKDGYSALPVTSDRNLEIGHNLAWCKLELGAWDEAEQFVGRVFTDAERRHGSGSLQLAPYLLLRAAVAARRGRFSDAEADLRRALAISESAALTNLAIAARSRNDLGTLLIMTGREREALPELRRAHELAASAPGFEPRWRVLLAANRADAESLSGNPEVALALAREAESAALAFDPPARATLAQCASVRAWVEFRRGEHDAMEAALADAARLVKGAPDEELALGRIAGLRALVCNVRGDAVRAHAEAELALAHFGKAGAAESARCGAARYQRGWSKLARGDVPGAQTDFRAAIEICRRDVPDGHPFEAFALDHLGETLVQEETNEAILLFERALEIRRRCLEASDDWIAVSRHNLGFALARAGGDDERALELFDENLDVLRALRRMPDARLAATLFQAALLRRERGELDLAASHARESLQHWRRLEPLGGVRVTETQALLDETLAEIERRRDQR